MTHIYIDMYIWHKWNILYIYVIWHIWHISIHTLYQSLRSLHSYGYLLQDFYGNRSRVVLRSSYNMRKWENPSSSERLLASWRGACWLGACFGVGTLEPEATRIGQTYFQDHVIPYPIGSMYGIYGNMDPINIPQMLAYIPAPWILWVWWPLNSIFTRTRDISKIPIPHQRRSDEKGRS